MTITITVENPDKSKTTTTYTECTILSEGPPCFKFKGKKSGSTAMVTYRIPLERICEIQTDE